MWILTTGLFNKTVFSQIILDQRSTKTKQERQKKLEEQQKINKFHLNN